MELSTIVIIFLLKIKMGCSLILTRMQVFSRPLNYLIYRLEAGCRFPTSRSQNPPTFSSSFGPWPVLLHPKNKNNVMELKIVLIFEKEKISFLIQVRFVIVGIRFPIYQLNINTELWIAYSISRSGAYLVNRHLLGLFTGSVSGACSLFSKSKINFNDQVKLSNLNN